MTVARISHSSNLNETNTFSKTLSYNWNHHRVQVFIGASFIVAGVVTLAASTLLLQTYAWIAVTLSIISLIQGMLIGGSGLFQPIPQKINNSKPLLELKIDPPNVSVKKEPNYVEFAFKKLTGKPFVEDLSEPNATPEMEYMVHTIFQVIAEKDNLDLKFLLQDLEEMAPHNLYSVAKVGLMLARKYNNTEALPILREFRDKSEIKAFKPS